MAQCDGCKKKRETYRFLTNLRFHAVQSSGGPNNLPEKMENRTGGGIVFPGRYPRVTVEQLEQLHKLNTAKLGEGGE